MINPYTVSSAFVLAVIILCIAKPLAGRIFLGFFFLAMALGVNGYFVLTDPGLYVEYASGALIPFYRTLAVTVVSVSPVAFAILLILFEVTMALLILHRGRAVQAGLLGTMIFVAGISPLNWWQLPWLGLLIGQGWLMRFTYDRSLLDMLCRKHPKGAPCDEH